jgi:hypothetical protein
MEFAQFVVSTPYVLNILVFFFIFMMCSNKQPGVMERSCLSCISVGKEEMQLKAIIGHTLIVNFAQTNVNT